VKIVFRILYAGGAWLILILALAAYEAGSYAGFAGLVLLAAGVVAGGVGVEVLAERHLRPWVEVRQFRRKINAYTRPRSRAVRRALQAARRAVTAYGRPVGAPDDDPGERPA
jgi:hypothetical protein